MSDQKKPAEKKKKASSPVGHGKPPVEYQFKKRQVANPGGRKALPPDVRKAKHISYEEMCRAVIKARKLTPAEYKKLVKKDLTFGEAVIIEAYVKRRYIGIKQYEDRLWGKAKEYVELSSGDGDRLFPTPEEIVQSFEERFKEVEREQSNTKPE